MAHVPESISFTQRIPIPENCEEVEVKRRISVPGKPAVYVSAMELRLRKGVPVRATPVPVVLKSGVKKPNPQPVKETIRKPIITPVNKVAKAKPKLGKESKRVFNRQPVGARQHGGAPRCSFCGGGMAAEIGSIHARCQEAKDRIAGKK
jgi:hypothetical protein